MARNLRRAVAVLVAVGAGGADAIGALLSSDSGHPLAGWQLTCLGVGLPAAVLGLLIVWHLPRNRIAWIFLAAASGFGLDQLCLGMLASPGLPAWSQVTAYRLLLLCPGPLTVVWILLILLFPEGRFQRPLWRGYAALATAAALIAAIVEFLLAPAGYLPLQYGTAAPGWLAGPLSPGASAVPMVQLLDLLPGLLLPAFAMVGLIDRYRSTSASGRQQIKWLLFGVATTVAVQLAFIPLSKLGIREPGAVKLAVAPLPTLGAALAIFRYRLWDIDRLLSRTLAFALLWGLTAGAFVALAGLAGLAIGGLDRRVLAAVTLSLLAALILQPLRGQLETGISRVVYGRRPHGYAVLDRLADAAKASVPISDLAELIAGVAKDAVGLSWASVWLRMEVDGRVLLREAGSAGDGDHGPDSGGILIDLDESRAAADLGQMLPQPVGAVLPLEAAGEVVGFLACGRSGSREIAEDDREVLTLVAHQAAVLLRSGRLEEELRERLEELRESRQRLVRAQDEERRRLERDLHDGIQQQLVGLAAKLKRISGSAVRPADLEALAEEAEEAVFAMQDLARGIYPSALIDQGLAIALRAHAARLPLEILLEMEPGLAAERFKPEVEACLYFVAMEAITNAQKHSGSAAVTISIRFSEPANGLALEVHDAGRGFDPRARQPGSGIQNMRDRLTALGGKLSVRSEPGAGTWLLATLPLPADLLPLQRPGMVSRR